MGSKQAISAGGVKSVALSATFPGVPNRFAALHAFFASGTTASVGGDVVMSITGLAGGTISIVVSSTTTIGYSISAFLSEDGVPTAMEGADIVFTVSPLAGVTHSITMICSQLEKEY